MPLPRNDAPSIDPSASAMQMVENLHLGRPRSPAPPIRQRLADFAYVGLVTTGWFAGNVLGALGCAVAFFIILSAGEWEAFFVQIDNLTSRYVDADLGRRGMFEHHLVQAFMLVFLCITVLRAPSFIRRVRCELAKGGRA